MLMVAAGAAGWWIGSNAGSLNIPEVVDQYTAAWVDGDADALAALYTEYGVYQEIGLADPVADRVTLVDTYTGRASIRSRVSMGMGGADFDSLTVDPVTLVDDVISFEWTSTGTSNGLPFETSGVSVFEMDGDLIARHIIYYNGAELFNVSGN